MEIATLLSFAAAFFVFAASPGPDNMTIVARILSHGPVSGIVYGLGTVCGIVIFLAIAAFGLSAVATEMTTLMVVLRYAGAVWLVWMGVKLWTADPVVPDVQMTQDQRGLWAVFSMGIALNLGNPKMPLFYLALLPNVVGPSLTGSDLVGLIIVILLVEVIVIGGYVLLAQRAQRLLRTPSVVRRANRFAGGTMVGAGLTVAAAH